MESITGSERCVHCEVRRIVQSALESQHPSVEAKLLTKYQVSSLLRLAVRAAFSQLLMSLYKRL